MLSAQRPPSEKTTSLRLVACGLWESDDALLDLLSNGREAKCDVSDAKRLLQAFL
jgi:hypothetical protein